MKALEKKYLLPFALVTSLFLLWGLANNMTDTLLAAFKRIMDMSDAQTSLIQFAFYGSYFCFALPAAIFISRHSFKSGIILGLLLYAAGAILFLPAAYAASYGFYLVAIYIMAGGCSVVEGKDINEAKVTALAAAADACWDAILRHDLDTFAEAYLASFKAQTAMFPGMVNPSVNGELCKEASVQPYIDRYSALPEVLAWKMPGAGGGGYLVLVVKDAKAFAQERKEAIEIHIRRQ